MQYTEYKGYLEELFLRMDKEDIKYLVLRGYEDLPGIVHHDLDFAVHPESLKKFFILLHELSKVYDYIIIKDTVRCGLLKVYLAFSDKKLQLDIFCEFRYAGLEYININDLFLHKRKLDSEIFVPNTNYELAISFLKEILHNSRIREDKVHSIRRLYNKSNFLNPFINYFSHKFINKFSEALFDNEKLVFKEMASQARFNLLYKNVIYYGVFVTCYNIIIFFWIKYMNQKKYDKVIFSIIK